ncbi:methionine synthase [Humisphaera borealis]|uniref:Methionine synthase n=1 Tax=Humisphaera borealis TaxID=2807512 RepID=A0A7M2WUT2_9BACT|nr:methionine synthase [Humisphaera borealis]
MRSSLYGRSKFIRCRDLLSVSFDCENPVRKPFLELARERVVVLDGAMGSNLQIRPLDLQKDWLGQENISEVLNFSRPDVIQEIHEAFLAVGCDGVETNTFGANKIVMAEADMADRVYENNIAACKIARAACDKYETPDRPRYVIGSVGPGTKILTLGHTDWDTMEDSYFEQFRGLIDGGADVLLIETQQDMLVIKCAIAAANRAMKQAGKRLPIMVQASFDLNGGQNMLTGCDPSAFVATFEPFADVDVLGLNCAFGPTELTETMKYITGNWPKLVSALPNAGLPIMVDGKSVFPMNPADFTKGVKRFVSEFGVNIVGGCCGTMPEHLKALVDAVGVPNAGRQSPAGHRAAARDVHPRPQISSLMSAEDIRQDKSYLIVAERTNTNGSKKFKTLLQADDWDGLVSMARDEMRDGSHMLDVCVDFVGRDGVRDMHEVVRRYVNALPAPLMLDSTNPAVMEAGLKLAGGRCILNSMNLEEGEEKLGQICELARKYGAAVVAGCIDEDKLQAMARTRERKISIAKRIRDLAVDRFGLRDEDLMFDPLVLPISTGIEEDRRNAMETIEGTRLISQQLPKCHTTVGLSNVSFGLKPASRIVLNSAFLHELREAGLTSAIVHASKILPKNRIPQEQWDAALELIYDRRKEGFDPLTHFIGLFPDNGASAVAVKADPWEGLSIEEILKKHIIDGEKRALIDHLEVARTTYTPLEIINNILLEGMKVVGDLFGSGQMQLPFVLQSAETMKASVAHLEQYMEKVEGQSKGKIVLATVKGDVHDIGKNLVDIILTNNGYTVYNLGIKQPVDEILKAAEMKKADAVGMSGLLVKSVAVMRENLVEMNARGVKVPVLLGGAALTRDYAEDDLASLYGGPLLYCRDAFDGLHMMDAITGGLLQQVSTDQKERAIKRKRQREESQAKYGETMRAVAKDAPDVAKDNPVPIPPFWGRRVVKNIDVKHIFPFINETALFTGQWGLSKGKMSPEEYETFLNDKARPVFADLQKRAAAEGFLEPAVVYGYFPVQADGDELVVYEPEAFNHPIKCDCGVNHGGTVGMRDGKLVPHGKPVEVMRFAFPRQVGRRQLCISDFYRTKASGEFDVLALQLVTVGDKSTEVAEKLRTESKYQDYLYLHGFGVESAEALAEFWHKRVRQELGFGSEDDPSIKKLFQQKYRGSRYSFGYPACPDLEQRTKIVELLKPQEIGVVLSENYMLVPEQSTDAIVAHHPQAKYFDV